MAMSDDALRVLKYLRQIDSEVAADFPSDVVIGRTCLKALYPSATDTGLRRKALNALAELEQVGLIEKQGRSLKNKRYALL